MAPKRKRAESPAAAAAAESSTSTGNRTSKRLAKGDTTKAESTAETTEKRTTKKAKTTSSKATSSSAKAGKKTTRKEAPHASDKSKTNDAHVPKPEATIAEAAPTAPVAKPSAPKPSAPKPSASQTFETYSAARAQKVYQQYADPDEPDVIGGEGFEKLCTEAQVNMEGAMPLLLAWQLEAKTMGKISKTEWETGTKKLEISSLPLLRLAIQELDDLLISDRPLVLSKAASNGSWAELRQISKVQLVPSDPYQRSHYYACAKDKKTAFSKFYTFCFALAKPVSSRNLDMETSQAFWSVLLQPRFPIMGEVIEFINERGSYKGVNKDLWNMMLEFCLVSSDLDSYEMDGAWPTMLDDFVAWKREKTTSS